MRHICGEKERALRYICGEKEGELEALSLRHFSWHGLRDRRDAGDGAFLGKDTPVGHGRTARPGLPAARVGEDRGASAQRGHRDGVDGGRGRGGNSRRRRLCRGPTQNGTIRVCRGALQQHSQGWRWPDLRRGRRATGVTGDPPDSSQYGDQ